MSARSKILGFIILSCIGILIIGKQFYREERPKVIARVSAFNNITLDLVWLVHPGNPNFEVIPWQSRIVQHLPLRAQIWLENAGVPQAWNFEIEPLLYPRTIWMIFYVRSPDLWRQSTFINDVGIGIETELIDQGLIYIRADLGHGDCSKVGKLEQKDIMAAVIGAKDFIPFQTRLDDIPTSQPDLILQFVDRLTTNPRISRSFKIPNPLYRP